MQEKDTVEPTPIAEQASIDSSDIDVALNLDYRQKGLLWYSTYTVNFSGLYAFRNQSTDPRRLEVDFLFPSAHALYDGLTMEVNGQPIPIATYKDGALASLVVAPNQIANLRIAYRSQGLDTWRYKLGDEVTQSRNFKLSMLTNFKDVDFPANTLSPTLKRETGPGWALTWQYKNLISGFQIGMEMPAKLQPGPLAAEISYFAPISLLIFFFLMFIITTMRSIDLHPMNYFFLATAFFSFHLLLAYLVDHISIHAAFVISSAISIFLVVTYLRLVVGLRFAVVEAGFAQLIYLVLFSYTFFWKGFSGLAGAIGCVATLYVVMQMTGRIRWQDKFAAIPAPPPAR
jgi:hypothetical protein